MVVCLHVDDLLVTTDCKHDLEDLEASLKKAYGTVESQRGPRLSYLGMNVHINPESTIEVTQPGFAEDVLRQYNVEKEYNLPTEEQLRENPSGDAVDTPIYLSKLMKVMYLAQRTRPDILLPVSTLATRSQNPRVSDDRLLDRVLGYVKKTLDKGLTYRTGVQLGLYAYADASYAVHQDMKSHTGVTVHLSVNGGSVYASSTKQKLVTRSSTEAELVALDTACKQVIWMKDILRVILGEELQETVLFQDNKSTMSLAHTGLKPTGKSKHIDVRYFAVKEAIDEGVLKVEYKKTTDMIADVLTKSVPGSNFRRLSGMLLGV